MVSASTAKTRSCWGSQRFGGPWMLLSMQASKKPREAHKPFGIGELRGRETRNDWSAGVRGPQETRSISRVEHFTNSCACDERQARVLWRENGPS